MNRRIALDVSHLPTFGWDRESPMWWGTLAYVALEGTGFAIAIGAYFYLRQTNPAWPIDGEPPHLLAGTLSLIFLLASLWPNHLASRYAREMDLRRCRLLLVAMSFVGIVPLVIRGFEFAAIGVKWNANAYGSIVWALFGLHTLHLVTDVVETFVLTALMFTRHGHGKRFSDISDNAFYWDFVVASWVVLYVVLYWVPRW